MPTVDVVREERLQANPEEELIQVKFKSSDRGFRIRAKSPLIAAAMQKLSNGRKDRVSVQGTSMSIWAVPSSSLVVPDCKARVRVGEHDSLFSGNSPTFAWLLFVDLATGIDIVVNQPTTKEQRETYEKEFLKWVKGFYSSTMMEEEVTLVCNIRRG